MHTAMNQEKESVPDFLDYKYVYFGLFIYLFIYLFIHLFIHLFFGSNLFTFRSLGPSLAISYLYLSFLSLCFRFSCDDFHITVTIFLLPPSPSHQSLANIWPAWPAATTTTNFPFHPLDPTIALFFHKCNGRVPATFEPKDYQPGYFTDGRFSLPITATGMATAIANDIATMSLEELLQC